MISVNKVLNDLSSVHRPGWKLSGRITQYNDNKQAFILKHSLTLYFDSPL